MKLQCPNCYTEYTYPDDADWHNGDGTPHGCGQCAQARVRPRSLYGLVKVEDNAAD